MYSFGSVPVTDASSVDYIQGSSFSTWLDGFCLDRICSRNHFLWNPAGLSCAGICVTWSTFPRLAPFLDNFYVYFLTMTSFSYG